MIWGPELDEQALIEISLNFAYWTIDYRFVVDKRVAFKAFLVFTVSGDIASIFRQDCAQHLGARGGVKLFFRGPFSLRKC